MAEADGDHPPWIDLGVYAERTGQHIDAVRSAVRRGRLNARKGNDGRWLVPMPDEGAPQLDEGISSATAAPDPGVSSSLAASVHEAMTALRAVLTEARAAESFARAEAARLRDDLAASDVARAVAEAKVAAADELLAELRRALDHERAWGPSTEVDRHPAALDKLQAELEEAQRQLKARDLMIDALQQPPRPWWRRLRG